MTLKAALVQVLKSQCAAVYPNEAPANPPAQYVVWLTIGGRSMDYVDGSAPAQRNALVQVEAWASTRLAADALIANIDTALRAAADLTVAPQGEPFDDHDTTTRRYGAIQRFSIYGARN